MDELISNTSIIVVVLANEGSIIRLVCSHAVQPYHREVQYVTLWIEEGCGRYVHRVHA
jgi:hypothetical protein